MRQVPRRAREVEISTAFGCTIQARVDEREVVRLVQAVLDAGVDTWDSQTPWGMPIRPALVAA